VIELTIELSSAPNEMVQEEILKLVTHVSRDLRHPRFSADGMKLHFEFLGDATAAETVRDEVAEVARKIQRSLRRLERKVIHRTETGWDRIATPPGTTAGIHFSGVGQVQLIGPALLAVQRVSAMLAAYSAQWSPAQLQTPTLIPAPVLARCDYFRSFPQYVSFVSHLHEDFGTIDGFRTRHQERESLDDQARHDLDIPGNCLSPAVCYHVYHRHAGARVPETGLTYEVQGRCFRFESTNLSDLRRLWEFTMRELVFVGTKEWVLARREEAIAAFIPLLDSLRLPSEIRTASDPFFVAPDATAKTYFQLSSETKYEISVGLGGDERLAVGSFNYHTDFFGRAFETEAGASGPAHSVCVAFGLERLVHAILGHHGPDPEAWPEVLRENQQ
jgi:seryl-tRNA synthetase